MKKRLRKLLDLFRGSDYRFLAQLLVDPRNRDFLMGVNLPGMPEKKVLDSDAKKVLNYCSSSDYAVWAREAWAQVVEAVRQLSVPSLSDSEVSFHRGALCQALALLRKSYDYRAYLEAEKAKPHTETASWDTLSKTAV